MGVNNLLSTLYTVYCCTYFKHFLKSKFTYHYIYHTLIKIINYSLLHKLLEIICKFELNCYFSYFITKYCISVKCICTSCPKCDFFMRAPFVHLSFNNFHFKINHLLNHYSLQQFNYIFFKTSQESEVVNLQKNLTTKNLLNKLV